MPDKIITRMGDGARVELSPEQVKEDILAGTQDAADRGKIPQLNPDEQEQLFEMSESSAQAPFDRHGPD